MSQVREHKGLNSQAAASTKLQELYIPVEVELIP